MEALGLGAALASLTQLQLLTAGEAGTVPTANKPRSEAVQAELAEGVAGAAWKLQWCPICVGLSHSSRVYLY